ncbi:MAG: hypothetical protein WAV41_04820 [Microgenomates group bacterium]
MNLKSVIIFGLLLRLLIAPFFYHPDIKSQYFHFQFLSQGVYNIYDYLEKDRLTLPYQDTFNYQPLTYLVFGTINIFLSPLYPADFYVWINDWGPDQNNYPNLPIFLLILKLPYLLLDLGIGYLLYRKLGQKPLLLWLFNPFSLYFIYVLGNFDIIPVFLTVLAWYFFDTRKSLSFLFLGIATSLKLYPLLFLPFFIFFKTKDISKNLFFFLLPVALSTLPFLSSNSFLHSFVGSGLSQKVFELKLYSLPLFPLIYGLIFIKYIISSSKNIPLSLTYVFLLFISTVSFHGQWLLWFIPFILISTHKSLPKIFFFVATLTLSLLYLLLTDDKYLVWGHFIPVDTQFIYQPYPYQYILHRFLINPVIFQNYLKIIIGLLSTLFFLVK